MPSPGPAPSPGNTPDAGFRFVLIHVTDGEAGEIHTGFPATRATLGAIRRAECAAALRAVGANPIATTGSATSTAASPTCPSTGSTDRIAAVLEEEAPDVVATFGPDSITGHPDHIAVGVATDGAFARLAGKSLPGFRRLLHHVLPQAVFDRWQEQRRALDLPVFDPAALTTGAVSRTGRSGWSSTAATWPPGSSPASWSTEASSHAMADTPLAPRLERIVRREWASVIWPAPTPSDPILTDIFDGIRTTTATQQAAQ